MNVHRLIVRVGDMHEKLLNEHVLAMKIAMTKPRECPFAFFLGAGCSVSSGIPSASSLIEDWKRVLWIGASWQSESYEAWLQKEYKPFLQSISDGFTNEYASLFEYLYRTRKERQLVVESICENIIPGFGYLYLSCLINEKKINMVLTTNFDDLIADSLVKYFDIKPVICSTNASIKNIRIDTTRPKVIKLHGDYLFDSIKNTSSETKELEHGMKYSLLEIGRNYGIIVVGYSGSDESIMNPIAEMLKSQDNFPLGLHWCVKKEIGAPQIPDAVMELYKLHPDRFYIYEIEGFDYLLESVFTRCKCNLPSVLVEPYKNSTAKLFYESVSTQELTNGMRRTLINIIESSATPMDLKEYHIIQAEMLKAEGLIVKRKGNIKESQDLFLRSKTILESKINEIIASDSPSLIVRAYQNIGGILISLAKLSKMLNKNEVCGYLEQAIDYLEKGILFIKSSREEDQFVTHLKHMLYNQLCALSLHHEYCPDNTDPSGNSKLVKMFEKFTLLVAMEIDKTRISRLFLDDDFKHVLTQNKKKLETILKDSIKKDPNNANSADAKSSAAD